MPPPNPFPGTPGDWASLSWIEPWITEALASADERGWDNPPTTLTETHKLVAAYAGIGFGLGSLLEGEEPDRACAASMGVAEVVHGSLTDGNLFRRSYLDARYIAFKPVPVDLFTLGMAGFRSTGPEGRHTVTPWGGAIPWLDDRVRVVCGPRDPGWSRAGYFVPSEGRGAGSQIVLTPAGNLTRCSRDIWELSARRVFRLVSLGLAELVVASWPCDVR